MSRHSNRVRLDHTHAEIMAIRLDDRVDPRPDAVITAVALVAGADGWIDPVERYMLVDFMDRNRFLAVFTHAKILDAFERSVRQLEEPGQVEVAMDSLGRLSGRVPALVVDAAWRVALADACLHPLERQRLQLIHIALGAAPNVVYTGGIQ